jgi:hypothetical protein
MEFDEETASGCETESLEEPVALRLLNQLAGIVAVERPDPDVPGPA